MRLTDKAKKTPEKEKAQALSILDEIGSLSEISEQLSEMRERAALAARRKDIEHVDRLDRMMANILDSILDKFENDPKSLSDSIGKIVEKGLMHQLKNLMITLAIAAEKRELLLGFDETRKSKDRRLKLQVVFKGKDGEQAGVSIEQ